MQNNNLKIWGSVVIIVVILGILFLWPRITNPKREQISQWGDINVDCLTMGHTNISSHIHSDLEVYVDGQKEVLSRDIGVARNCMAEIHTHDDSGVIHLESASSEKQFTLSQFFGVWGKTMEREGYNTEVIADGLTVADPANLVLKDRQQIVIKYTKK